MKDIYNQFGIYRITHKATGRSYIGKTGVNFGDRWDCHRAQLNGGYHDNKHLQNAWNRYGADAFEFAVVEVAESSEVLNNLEKKYIAEYRSRGLSYNMHDGGDGGFLLGKHLSDVAKRKIGEKNRVHQTGRKASVETRKRMSAAQSERWRSVSDEEKRAWGDKMSIAASGYKWSDDARARFSQTQKERPNGARFTPDDIREIRRKKASGIKLTDLANEYHTSPSYISSIVHRRRWAEIN